MEEILKLIESLYEKAIEYLKTSFELVKLKAIDKSTDVVSSFFPLLIVFIFISTFLLLLNLGLSIWLGEVIGNISYGFFAVAFLNCLAVLLVHFFMHKWLKKIFKNYLIKMILK